MHASTPLSRLIYNFDALTLSDLDGVTPAQLRKLAALCDHWHDIASIRLAERRHADVAARTQSEATPTDEAADLPNTTLPNSVHPLEASE